MSEFTRPIEDLGREVLEYVDLKVDDVKLRTAKGISMTMSKLLYMLLVLFVLSVALFSLAIAGVLWIGELIGSYALGAMVVSGFFLLVLLVLFFLRKRLFRNAFVPLASRIFFDVQNG
jgi:hypothetical protein